MINKKKFKIQAKIVKAMAHPTRLFIIETLSKNEKCVCELQKMIKVDISTVSKHLLVMKNAGIIEDEKRGNQRFYKLRVPCILDFFGCIEKIIKKNISDQIF